MNNTPECPFTIGEFGTEKKTGETLKYIGRQETQGCLYDWFSYLDNRGGILVFPWDWGTDRAEIFKIKIVDGMPIYECERFSQVK